MHTLFDFVTHIKAVEYILSIMFIAGFILYWEILKIRPFRTLANTTSKDIVYIKESGKQHIIEKIATALFLTLTYVVSLPFVFAYAVLSAIKDNFTHSGQGKHGPGGPEKG